MSSESDGADFRLRPAREGDQRSIRTLVRSTGINPMGLDWPHFWVAVDLDDRLIGCAQVKPHSDDSRELASVAVRPRWRRRRIATALIARLQQLNEPPLWLTCRSRLVPFYERSGFVEVQDDPLMPRYFRRIRRLMNTVLKVLPRDEYLAVMIWRG